MCVFTFSLLKNTTFMIHVNVSKMFLFPNFKLVHVFLAGYTFSFNIFSFISPN